MKNEEMVRERLRILPRCYERNHKRVTCRVANKVGILCAIKTGIVGNSQKVGIMDFSLWNWLRQGMPGRQRDPTCRLPGFWQRSGCVPAEPYPPQKRVKLHAKACKRQQKLSTKARFSNFDRTVLASFDRTTTVFFRSDEVLARIFA